MTAEACPSTALAAIGVVLALGLPALPLGSWIAPGDALGAHVARELVWWGVGAVMLGWVLIVERLPLGSIGLRPLTLRGVGWALLVTVLMMASVMLSYAVIFPALGLTMNHAAVASLTHVPLWLQTATVVRAGVVEEILFRGYAIERLALLVRSRKLAGLISAAAFIAVHISAWGYAQLIVVSFGAVILTVFYLWRRDLAANMVAHGLTDFIGFMLARLQGA